MHHREVSSLFITRYTWRPQSPGPQDGLAAEERCRPTIHSVSPLGEGLTSCSGPCGGTGRNLAPTVLLLGGMQRTMPHGGHRCPATPLPSLIAVGLTCQGRHPSSSRVRTRAGHKPAFPWCCAWHGREAHGASRVLSGSQAAQPECGSSVRRPGGFRVLRRG